MSRRIIVDELEFEVDYGKLAAKTWHEEEEDSKRVLCLHGWMDNSGSFDNLIPLLKHQNGLYVVALDLPGHGKSSQLPAGVSYADVTMILEVRRCLKDLGWTHDKDSDSAANKKKFTILGHSFGGGLGLLYASLYPDEVEELIMFDFIKSQTSTKQASLGNLARVIDQFLDIVPSKSSLVSGNRKRESDKGSVVVQQETAIIATIEAHKSMGCISRDDASCLLKRSTVPVSTPPNSVIYSRDLRLQCMLNVRDDWELNKLMFAGVKCHVLALLGNKGLYKLDPLFIDHLDDMEQYLKERCKSLNVQWVDADHYLHLNNPKLAAELVNSYLKDPQSYKI